MAEPNQDTRVARQFHDATKYVRIVGQSGSEELLMGLPGALGPAIGEQDPAIEPLPYKIYTGIDPIPLPRDFPPPTLAALDAIAASGDLAVDESIPDLAALARICLRSNGILKRWRSPTGREIEFRAAGCTGARYHLELYLVCRSLPGLAAGVYHYAAHDHSLRLLRAGDHRSLVIGATGAEPATARAPVVAILTSTFWRNAWRYQARAYRHVYWDAGTLMANLVAVAADERLPSRVILGFADREINALLDVDGDREATVALVALGRTPEAPPPAPGFGPLGLTTRPLSSREIVFPEIGQIHSASNLDDSEAAKEWRTNPLQRPRPTAAGSSGSLQPVAKERWPNESIDDVIARRRSNRHYAADEPIAFDLFSTVLERATRPVAIDALDHHARPLHDVYLIANNVDGLESGSYVLDRERLTLESLNAGDQRLAAARLACNQDYAAQAQVNAYALTDLAPVLERYGNRGYRLAQLEAAFFGARLQLAAHALGLGAVGSTSADDDVTEFFSPDAAGKSFMFVAVFGRRRRPSAAEVAAKSRFLQREASETANEAGTERS